MAAILDFPDCEQCGCYYEQRSPETSIESEESRVLCEDCRESPTTEGASRATSWRDIDRQLERIRSLRRRFPDR
jgi:hypothetical protein